MNPEALIADFVPVPVMVKLNVSAEADGVIAKTVANASKATENFVVPFISRAPCGTAAG
jgi:hypothetical protein